MIKGYKLAHKYLHRQDKITRLFRKPKYIRVKNQPWNFLFKKALCIFVHLSQQQN